MSFGYISWLGGVKLLFFVFPIKRVAHHFMPNRGGDVHPIGFITHWFIIVVPCPYPNDERRSIPHCPSVAVFLSSSCFYRYHMVLDEKF